jgi:phosphoserine phosphatase RsbU/P
MLLRTRLTLLAIGVLTLYSLLVASLLLERDRRFDARLAEEVLYSQRVAWEKTEAEQRDRFAVLTQRVLASREVQDALARGDGAACSRAIGQLRDDATPVRFDVQLPDRGLICSNFVAGDALPAALADGGMVRRVLVESPVISGLVLGQDQRFHWLRGERVDLSRMTQRTAATGYAIIVASSDIAGTLPALKRTLAAEVFLTSLSGRLVQGTHNAVYQSLSLQPPWNITAVERARQGGTWLLAASQPVRDPAGRSIGMLVALRDVSAAARAELVSNITFVGIAILLVVVTGLLLFHYLRNVLDPLARAVEGLDALARGDTNHQMHMGEQRREDEAGKINQGIALLRSEMVNFQMLRDERNRARKQQERVIREQLRVLAGNLDPGSREDVLRELEAGLSRAGGGASLSLTGRLQSLEVRSVGENELTVLAGILGRMSGIISTQQGKLLKLIKEVQAAAEARARLAGLQQELEIARRMQLSILPLTAPVLPNVEVASLMIPAKEVGGDFYDYFMLDEKHLAVIVADVSGKGVPAAFFMAISRTLLRGIAKYAQSGVEMMGALNDQLAADNEQTMFVTAFYGVLDVSTGRFVFVNCGHNPPAVMDGRGGARFLPITKSMALAVMEGIPFVEEEFDLAPGETLVMFTDGVTEAQDAEGALYGEARLGKVLTRLAPDAMTRVIPTEILHDIRAFERGAAQADDITCVALRYLGTSK